MKKTTIVSYSTLLRNNNKTKVDYIYTIKSLRTIWKVKKSKVNVLVIFCMKFNDKIAYNREKIVHKSGIPIVFKTTRNGCQSYDSYAY